MSVDTSKDFPHSFSLADIEPACSTFAWKDEAYHSTLSELRPGRRGIDEPPPPDVFTGIVKRVGDASKDARRVEVSFQRIAPTPAAYWTSDSRRGIDVPLGRAGRPSSSTCVWDRGRASTCSSRGRPARGSRRSCTPSSRTLRSTTAADEVNFYLIDFKKGVEFKDYAQFELPHARVVAIESDREFGVSRVAATRRDPAGAGRTVPQARRAGHRRLSATRIRRRRCRGSCWLSTSSRSSSSRTTSSASPRHSSSDRLVRQGRAFGMHVILGSQTLGGAYSSARARWGRWRSASLCSAASPTPT